jgi:hypothetical protein
MNANMRGFPDARGATPTDVVDEGGGFTPTRVPIMTRAGNGATVSGAQYKDSRYSLARFATWANTGSTG